MSKLLNNSQTGYISRVFDAICILAQKEGVMIEGFSVKCGEIRVKFFNEKNGVTQDIAVGSVEDLVNFANSTNC